MRVVICWTEIAGYTAACWGELAARPNLDLLVLAWPSNLARSGTQFQRSILDGINVRLLEPHEQQNRQLVADLVAAHRPVVILTGGWAERPYRDLTRDPRLAAARIVLAMDTPWKGTLRQRLARLKIGRHIDRLDAVFVPGQRGQRFAQHLKMPDDRIFTGMLGFDFKLFENTLDARLAQPWPKRFVYLGRYSVEKALHVLIFSYAKYRKLVPDPWPLACFGSGPLEDVLRDQPGVEVNGWVQPADQPAVLARHGVSVLTSNTEAWGVAVAEAMASGLPVLCTETVGAVPDLIRPERTGLTAPTRDSAAIARGMKWFHDHYDHLPTMGQFAKETAAPYSAQNWAQRFIEMADAIRQKPVRRGPSS